VRKETEPDSKGLRHSLLLFFTFFIFLAGSGGGVAFVAYSHFDTDVFTDLLDGEEFGVQVRKDVVEEQLSSVVGDLEFIASQSVLKQYLQTNDKALLRQLGDDFLSLVSYKAVYDQIRLFDKRGMEIVRVNYNGGLPVIVPESDLQFKGKRYYFTDTMVLSKGEIFVSPLDLNVEKGQIEIPHKPMIRFGMPLYDETGMAVGAVVINYRAEKLLGVLRKAGGLTRGQTMLLNPSGYWLLAPDTRDQWGFMFAGKADVTFGSRFPKAWALLHDRDSGQFIFGSEIFTFSTIYPLQNRIVSSSGSNEVFGESEKVFNGDKYYWKLVSYIPDAYSKDASLSFMGKRFVNGAIFSMVVGSLAWLIGLLFIRKRLAHSVRHAVPVRDVLTGLVNERLYQDRVEEAVQNTMETGGFAIVRVMVDDLASLNNTYGDEVGDAMLLQTALRLKASFSVADTVARLRKAEFVVLLTRVHDREVLEDRLSMIRESLAAPFKLYESHICIAMTVTGGLYPEEAESPDRLLNDLRKPRS